MNPNDSMRDELETLSALHDGEVDGDARLFALRRLGHDPQWQRACGQWQLIGDVLRRQAPIAAPADFAGRVTAALATERSAAVSSAPAVAAVRVPKRRMRWIGGGALAASVALVVAVSAVRFGEAPAPSSGAVIASEPPAPAESSVAMRSSDTLAAGAAAPVQVATAPADAAANATASKRVATQAIARAAPATASASASSGSRRPAARMSAPTVSNEVMATALVAGQGSNPFNLGADQALTARPWPRAALGAGSAGAFTARYAGSGDSDEARPSFFPFEPDPQGEAERIPTP